MLCYLWWLLGRFLWVVVVVFVEVLVVVDVNPDLNLALLFFGEVSKGGDAGSGAAILGDVQVVVMQPECGDLQIEGHGLLLMVILVVVGDGYHKWWCLVLSWEAKYSLSLLVVVSSEVWR
ncbi:transmembrane protein, putative [Medicago truncatula]|uniref:Transmembrane protein, putative n=1 Tax=Medicago truncatula TaxID=3880 RepID=A0A072U2N7_MEDTR|nr:transmembrane protein, putative [Medicago truncatula]